MTQGEKAKAYDKAIEKIKYVMEHGVSPVLNKEDLKDIFPELKESEDEKIKKTLIKFHKSTIDIDGIKGEVIIKWLEKQGAQQAVLDELEMTLSVSEEGYLRDNIEKLIKELKTKKLVKIPQEREDEEVRQAMINFFKSERRKNGIAVLHFGVNIEKMITWLEKQGDKTSKWSEEDESKVEDIVYFLDTAKIHYASTKALDDCITWLKSLKQRIEQ